MLKHSNKRRILLITFCLHWLKRKSSPRSKQIFLDFCQQANMENFQIHAKKKSYANIDGQGQQIDAKILFKIEEILKHFFVFSCFLN